MRRCAPKAGVRCCRRAGERTRRPPSPRRAASGGVNRPEALKSKNRNRETKSSGSSRVDEMKTYSQIVRLLQLLSVVAAVSVLQTVRAVEFTTLDHRDDYELGYPFWGG